MEVVIILVLVVVMVVVVKLDNDGGGYHSGVGDGYDDYGGSPTRHSTYIEFHQDVGGSASHDLEGSSEHDHEELGMSRKNY